MSLTITALEERAGSYHHFQRDQFLAGLWHEVFGEIESGGGSTEEAILRANEAEARGAVAWAETH